MDDDIEPTASSDPADFRRDPELDNDGRFLECPVCGPAPIVEMQVYKILTFDGSRRVNEQRNISATDEARRVLEDLIDEANPGSDYIIRHGVNCSASTITGDSYSMLLAGEAATGKTHMFLGLIYLNSRNETNNRLRIHNDDDDQLVRLVGLSSQAFDGRVVAPSTVYRLAQDRRPFQFDFRIPIGDGQRFNGPVTMHDTAGEDNTGTARMIRVMPFVTRANYIVFCIDSTSLPGLGGAENNDTYQGAGVAQLVEGYAKHIREYHGRATEGDTEQAPISAAVVMTKADYLLEHASPAWSKVISNELRRFGRGSNFESWHDWASAVQVHDRLARDFLASLGGSAGSSIVSDFDQSFQEVTFHFASALGGPSSKDDSDGDQERFARTEYTLSGIVEPFARGYWRKAGLDPMWQRNSDQVAPW